MADAHNYLVPEYFSGFSCKGGSCRTTCCSGWGISISMGEYFRLLGLTCPPDLRRKLDCAFHPVDNPTPDRYAQITPNWLGKCPLHMDNGLCQLHAECGEEALPAVCRMYPRGAHTEFARECSCANSCERVLEMLFEMKEPMRFEEKELSLGLPEAEVDAENQAVRFYRPVRQLIFEALQNREYGIPERMALIGGMLRLLNEAFKDGESWIISGAVEVCKAMTPPVLPKKDERLILRTAYRLCRMFSKNASVEEIIAEAMSRLGFSLEEEPDDRQLDAAAKIFSADAARFDSLFPEWQRLFEQMLVNHVFFACFPFSARHETLWDEYMALCAVCVFVRFIAVTGMTGCEGEERLIDLCASAFRLIDHSAFDRNAAALFRAKGNTSFEEMIGITMA